MNQTVAAYPPANSTSLDNNHSHSKIVQLIPRYAQVLELGCSTGAMSRLMKEQCEAQVFGVEKDPQAAWQAQRYCDYVFTEDLDDPKSLDALQFEKFDVITLVDVLEHLRYPQQLLERLKPFMMDESVILLSVPNVAHTSVRLELLTGDFRYEEAGILDATHLKFFTLNSLKALIERSGFMINEIDYTWHDLPDSVIARYLRQVGVEATPRILEYFHQPDAVAYQFIISISLPKHQTQGKSNDQDLFKDNHLKPISASWQTWGHMFANLQQKEQVIKGLETAIRDQQDEVTWLKAQVQLQTDELTRVYATRSWRLLRKLAVFFRGMSVQEGLTHS
ncbi:MAG: class I SAM-dependent methyltransferase [Thiolinea sp.]